MASVVGVHGIGQQSAGPNTLYKNWFPALADGLEAAGGSIGPEGLVCAFYGDLFRPAGEFRSVILRTDPTISRLS